MCNCSAKLNPSWLHVVLSSILQTSLPDRSPLTPLAVPTANNDLGTRFTGPTLVADGERSDKEASSRGWLVRVVPVQLRDAVMVRTKLFS